MKKPRPPQDDRPGGLTHNPFAALRPEGRSESPAAPSPEPPRSGRLVVRREKKGRGGKTVTRVSGLELGEVELEQLAREMKRALGCGATVEEADILLQGALTERAAKWLRERTGAAVTIGN
jgi:translation initiation factor 1